MFNVQNIKHIKKDHHMLTRFKNLLWTLPFLSCIGGYLLPDIMYPQEEIETPALVGKNVEQALAILSNHNLNARMLMYKEDETMAQGSILAQTPLAAQKIKQNQSVYLVVSTKPQKIKAPHLLGQSLKDIDPMLQKNKIHAQSFYIESNYPQGQCFAQQPSPEKDLERDSMIIYLCAAKTKMMLVPNLKNKPLHLVLECLKTHPVSTEIIHTPEEPLNHQCDNCIVLDQRPLGGSIITMDDKMPLHMQLQVRFSE